LLVCGSALTLAGCDAASDASTDEPGAKPMMPEDIEYAPELGVDLSAMTRTETGLYLQDLDVGDGAEAEPGQIVHVHYTGLFPDGNSFDSSVGRDPFVFALGAGQVIAGWDEGVAGMKVGGRRILVLPYTLAYGEMGAGGVIPPYATLVFEVELLQVVQ
jgi:FKBP-type peptidyl-prolyl cis-trans isomerase